jgi:hypothetical protein
MPLANTSKLIAIYFAGIGNILKPFKLDVFCIGVKLSPIGFILNQY